MRQMLLATVTMTKARTVMVTPVKYSNLASLVLAFWSIVVFGLTDCSTLETGGGGKIIIRSDI